MADPAAIKMLQQDCGAWNRWRKERPDISPDLSKAELQGKILSGRNFDRTCFDRADLRGARLHSASLKSASFFGADLSRARLRDAWLCRTTFDKTLLEQTNFYHASLLDAAFLHVDLSQTSNLETITHLGPSSIDVDTLQRSRGKIPDAFLCGVGVSAQLLSGLRSSGQTPFDYATCFISYAARDELLVHKLYEQLRAAGVLCWFAPENLRAGEKFPASIPAAIQSHEKVLIVISKASLRSEWVGKEVQLARQKEHDGKKDVLLPISLDRAVQTTSVDWAVALRKRRHMRSFENWQQPSRWQKMCDNLLCDLRKNEGI
ncbi:MAG TPA: toll/interleukin-1 receptor domain-containing protein [Ktedonobacteraceae bacterium]|jgi:uncharacterized protein YjbI with pentapeptide repeats